MFTSPSVRWIRIGLPALVGGCLLGCQQVPLADMSKPAAKLESRQTAAPAASKKGKKIQPAGDSIPDAAEIGLTPAKS